MSIIEDERFCSNHTCHKSKTTPQRVPLSLYLHCFFTRERRAEQRHLLAEFSPILGFLGHILCLFVDGVNVFYRSLIFLCVLSILLVTKYSIDLKEINFNSKNFSILLGLF
jgi:hypothetical protein